MTNFIAALVVTFAKNSKKWLLAVNAKQVLEVFFM